MSGELFLFLSFSLRYNFDILCSGSFPSTSDKFLSISFMFMHKVFYKGSSCTCGNHPLTTPFLCQSKSTCEENTAGSKMPDLQKNIGLYCSIPFLHLETSQACRLCQGVCTASCLNLHRVPGVYTKRH